MDKTKAASLHDLHSGAKPFRQPKPVPTTPESHFDGHPMDGLTVAVIMRESLSTTLTFVSWYLRQGADRIVICFDDPADPAIDVLRCEPRVIAIPCTDAFWTSIGISPQDYFVKRQNKAMNFVYGQLVDGWFLNVDGDELVHLKDRCIYDELAATPDGVRTVTFRPAEALQSPDDAVDTHFRIGMSRPSARAVYGRLAPMMARRQGLSGHTVGKTATRAGLKDVLVRQHFVQDKDGEAVFDRVIGPEENAYLLHFFDQGFDAWRSKLPWRMSSRGFSFTALTMLQDALAAPDADLKLRRIYKKLHVFNAARREVLAQQNAHLAFRLGLDELVEAYFPGAVDRQNPVVRYAG